MKVRALLACVLVGYALGVACGAHALPLIRELLGLPPVPALAVAHYSDMQVECWLR